MFTETSLATVDSSPYFERVLRYAIEQGLIDDARLEAMKREGAKGIVQLAKFFSTAHLRPALESARTRLVTLVSLALEADSGRRMDTAARLLKEKSLLALSKSGADRLRQLLALPTDRLLSEDDLYREDEKRFLAWRTLEEPVTFARYLAERREREANRDHIDLAYRLAERLGLDRDSAQSLDISSESLVNSALLVLYAEKKPQGFFSVDRFAALHETARSKQTDHFGLLDEWAQEMPPALQRLIESEKENFLTQVLPIIRHESASKICNDHERFAGLFFFDGHSLDEIAHHDLGRAEQWRAVTGNHGSHTDVQCAVLLCVATGVEPVPSLRKKDATAIWMNYRTSGFDDTAVSDFIENVAPFEYQDDLRRLWEEDLAHEAEAHLDADKDSALLYLNQTCRCSWTQRSD